MAWVIRICTLAHLTLPPLCTSISGVLRAEILVPSSQAEWLQTGRTGPSAEVVLLLLLLLLLTTKDVSIFECCFCYLTLITDCFSIQFSSVQCVLYWHDKTDNMDIHTQGVDTKSWPPAQSNAIHHNNPLVKLMMLILHLYGNFWGYCIQLYCSSIITLSSYKVALHFTEIFKLSKLNTVC